MKTEYFDNREGALLAEKSAIKNENPVFNVIHNTENPAAAAREIKSNIKRLKIHKTDEEPKAGYVHNYPIGVGYDEDFDEFYVLFSKEIMNALMNDKPTAESNIKTALAVAKLAFSNKSKLED